MKHHKEITTADQADLDRAAQMVGDGKSLRQRVLARIRARVWRKGKQMAKREGDLSSMKEEN
jgi:hypothetical protein